jgi:hypothetical protein
MPAYVRDYPGGYYLPPGWQPVVIPILEQLEDMGADIWACREHFGALKIIVRTPSKEAQALAVAARDAVIWLCEDCGAKGTLRVSTNGHLKTCCVKHPPEPVHWRRDRDNFWDL